MGRKKSTADHVIAFVLVIVAIITFIPFYNVVILSFASPAQVAKQSYYIIPTSFDLSAYKMVAQYCKVDVALLNSLFVTGIGTLLNMLVTTCAAYALSKRTLLGGKVITYGILFTMIFSGGLIPYYLTIKNIGLINSRLSMVLPLIVNAFYFVIMRNYFKTVPEALEESAKIDGANDVSILFKIVLPVSLPTVAAVTLFYAVDRWNEWWNGLLFITDRMKFPMQLYLREMLVDVQRMMVNGANADNATGMVRKVYPDGLKMAVIVITVIPIICVYPYLQKYFTTGIMLGSVKE